MTPKLLNRLIYGGYLALFLAVALGWKHLYGIAPLSNTDPKGNSLTALAAEPLRLQDLLRRNLFAGFAVEPPKPKIVLPILPPAPVIPKIPISQKAARFKLVGILQGNPSQAVLEDTQSQTTLYATAGENVGELKVDKVLADRIELSADDERMELAL